MPADVGKCSRRDETDLPRECPPVLVVSQYCGWHTRPSVLKCEPVSPEPESAALLDAAVC